MIGAGFHRPDHSQAVSDNIDITVKYRFFNVPNVKMTAFNGQQTKMRFRTHSLLGGISAFGFLGLVLGPVIMATTIGMFDAYTKDRRTNTRGARG